MSEPVTLNESVKKLGESIAGLGEALSIAFSPLIAAMQTAAMQIAIEAEALSVALINSLPSFDWDALERDMTLSMPERWAEESLVDWGKRLERAGIFDSYEYRLMYGKECWRAVLHSPMWVVGLAWEQVRGKLGNAHSTEGE